jgi:hypothetical protein
MRNNKVAYLEATEKGMDDWIEHFREWQRLAGELANEVDSWTMGVNTNLAHKQKRSMMRYYGPAPGYRRRCDEVKGRYMLTSMSSADVSLGGGDGSSTAGREQ